MSSLPLADCQIEIQRGLTTSSRPSSFRSPHRNCTSLQRKPVLWLECFVQQPDYGGPEETEEPQWPDFGYSRLRQKFLGKARDRKRFFGDDDDIIINDPEGEYSPLVNRLKGQVIKISPNSTQFINPMDINANYSEEDNPLSLKADFILSLCELVVGGKEGLLPVEKTVIDRCVHLIYRKYFADPARRICPSLRTCTMPCSNRTRRSPSCCHGSGNLCERLPEPVQPSHECERQ